MIESLFLVSNDSNHGQSKKPLLSNTLHLALAAVSFPPLLVVCVIHFQKLYFQSPCQHFRAAASKLCIELGDSLGLISILEWIRQYDVIPLLHSANHRLVPAQDLIASGSRNFSICFKETGGSLKAGVLLLLFHINFCKNNRLSLIT